MIVWHESWTLIGLLPHRVFRIMIGCVFGGMVTIPSKTKSNNKDHNNDY